MKVLAVVNGKGGNGKSTLSAHLAWASAEYGLRTLVSDFDKQRSFTLMFPKLNPNSSGLLASSLFNSEITNESPEDVGNGISIIRADDRLALLDGAPEDYIKRPAKHLRHFAKDYDICVIDTPGLIGMRLSAALAAADAVICPVSVGLFEAAALSDLWQYIRAIKTKGYNPKLRLLGMLPSRINTKSKTELAGLEDLREKFGQAILPFSLPERAAVKQSISRRQPVWLKPKGAGHKLAATEWKTACTSILANLGSIA